MGFNDFHKDFNNNIQTRIASRPIIKQTFGVRSVEEVIRSRFQNRTDSVGNETPKVIIDERQSVGYQRVNQVNRNIRNLDK